MAIDDATNEVPNAVFREEEDDAGYFELVWGLSETHGLPAAFYTDRHTIFRSPKQATLEQELFNPFFTTKDSGMGLGLSISRSIVTSHGGRLWFTRNPDRGMTFHLTLPTAMGADHGQT